MTASTENYLLCARQWTCHLHVLSVFFTTTPHEWSDYHFHFTDKETEFESVLSKHGPQVP